MRHRDEETGSVYPLTSEQLFDVFAGVGRGELVHNVQGRLVIGIPDVHVNPGLRNNTTAKRCATGL